MMHSTGKSALNKSMGRYGSNYEDNLAESEDLLLEAIRNYFRLPWSRHFNKFDEHKLACKLLDSIARQIEMGHIPRKYNLFYFLPKRYWPQRRGNNIQIPNAPYVIYMVESYLHEIANFLERKLLNPDDVRFDEYREDSLHAR